MIRKIRMSRKEWLILSVAVVLQFCLCMTAFWPR